MYGDRNMNKLMLAMNKFYAMATTLRAEVVNNATDIESWENLALAFQGIMKAIIGPVLTVIGVAAVAYAIILVINYAKAEDADGRKKVQGRLIGAVIGAVIIIAGVTLCFALDWANIYKGFAETNYLS